MKIKFIIFFIIYLLSFNAKAEISQDGITNLKQLDKYGIIDLVNGNQLTGFISDGPFEGPITQTYFKNGTYETVYENKTYKGKWRAEGESYAQPNAKRMCTQNNNAKNESCFYWYTGTKDGGTYAFIAAQGKLFHQYHEVKSIDSLTTEEKETPKSTNKTTKKSKKVFEPKWVSGHDINSYLGYLDWQAQESTKKTNKSVKKDNSKKIDPIIMDCEYSVNGNSISYNWVYDGLNVYWEGAPLEIGKNDLDETMTIDVLQKGDKEFEIKIDMTLWQYDFVNNFKTKKSTIELYGAKGFGRCY